MGKNETFIFSVSQAELLEHCEKKWEFSYQSEIKRPPTHPALAFGGAFHTIADRFCDFNYKNAKSFAGAWTRCWFVETLGFPEGKYDLDALDLKTYSNGYFEKCLVTPSSVRHPRGVFFYSSDYDKMKEKIWSLHNRGKSICSRFYERNINLKNTGQILCHEMPFKFALGDFIVSGRIDRIDKGRNGKKFRLIDYKTGPSAGEPHIEDELSNGLMMSVYTLALLGARDNTRESRFKIDNPEELEVSIYLPDEQDDSKCYLNHSRILNDIEEAIEEMKKRRNIIRNGNFERNISASCKFCEFYGSCMLERERVVRYDGIADSGTPAIMPEIAKQKRTKTPKQLSLNSILEESAAHF